MPKQFLEGQAGLFKAGGPDLAGVRALDLAYSPQRLHNDATAISGQADQLRPAVTFVGAPLEIACLLKLVNELEHGWAGHRGTSGQVGQPRTRPVDVAEYLKV